MKEINFNPTPINSPKLNKTAIKDVSQNKQSLFIVQNDENKPGDINKILQENNNNPSEITKEALKDFFETISSIF